MADKVESTGRRNLYRALLAALFSSPIVVSLVVKYFDPIAVYKEMKDGPPPPPPPPPAPIVVVDAQWKPFLGMMRTSIFQSPTKYTLAEMDFTIKNTGTATSPNLVVQFDFAGDCTIQHVTGEWGMNFKAKDGTFKPIEQAKDWPEEEHRVVIHIENLKEAFAESGVISFYYETGKPATLPSVSYWDDKTTYHFNWPSADGK